MLCETWSVYFHLRYFAVYRKEAKDTGTADKCKF